MLRHPSWLLLPFALAFGLGLLFAQEAPVRKKYALLIGINKYEHAGMNQPGPLQFAEADAREMSLLLRESDYEVDLLLGNQATKQAIETKVAELRNKGNAEGIVLVGLAGHGIQFEKDDDAYFCPYDTAMRDAMRQGEVVRGPGGRAIQEPDPATCVKLTQIVEVFAKAKAGTRILLADCCRNDPTTGRGRGVGAGIRTGQLPDNTAVLLSCARGQQSWEHRDWGHGAFFYQVLNHLRTEDADALSLSRHLGKSVPAEVAAKIPNATRQTPHPLLNGGELSFQVHRADRLETFEYLFEGEKRAGKRRVWSFDLGGSIKLEMVRIPAGKFFLGAGANEKEAEDDKPQHEVELTRDFYLGKFEVTQAQYEQIMGNNPSHFKGKDLPVEKVSHEDARTFLARLSDRLKKKFDLPTEAEWEYACRANSITPFHWGSTLNGEFANCDGKYPWGTNRTGPSLGKTRPVGSYPANAWGLHDLHGNVAEWCADGFEADVYRRRKLPHEKKDPRVFPLRHPFRVVRGGDWDSTAQACRVSTRSAAAPGDGTYTLGFRAALRLD